MVQRADRNMVAWLEWAYCGCYGPDDVGPGRQAGDRDRPREAADRLATSTCRRCGSLVEPYPQLVAGTPQSWGFDNASKTFSFRYLRRTAASVRQTTEIAAPQLVYQNGYAAHVDGAGIVSSGGAEVLRIVACPGARNVSVRVTPGGSSGSSCRARLLVQVSPGVARLRHPTTFRISVSARPRRLYRARLGRNRLLRPARPLAPTHAASRRSASRCTAASAATACWRAPAASPRVRGSWASRARPADRS